jgi:hypothetical protein
MRRAGVHVDFHANRHFNDLRCFPGHFENSLNPRRDCRRHHLLYVATCCGPPTKLAFSVVRPRIADEQVSVRHADRGQAPSLFDRLSFTQSFGRFSKN